MNCDYAEIDWYCRKEKGHKGAHESHPLSEERELNLQPFCCPTCKTKMHNRKSEWCPNCRVWVEPQEEKS